MVAKDLISTGRRRYLFRWCTATLRILTLTTDLEVVRSRPEGLLDSPLRPQLEVDYVQLGSLRSLRPRYKCGLVEDVSVEGEK
jgi:hypothetical protein